jgi:hypothetical protein
MKRMLVATVVLVMLFGSVSSAFADEPQRVDQAISAVLGEVWGFYFNFGTPGLRVDAYLHRPSTLEGWPFPGGPVNGTYFMPIGESALRRQSYPSYQFTDQFGFYFAEFMLPRDEAWFPCSFPLKWKCNYEVGPGVIEYHSPAQMVFECREIAPMVVECLDWPWAGNPMDTVAPLEVELIDQFGGGYIIPFEVQGMFWKFSDIP